MPSVDPACQVCLAGAIISNWPLIQNLQLRHAVTMIESVSQLENPGLLSTTHLLVLDCSQNAHTALRLVPQITTAHPGLFVVLVDGGITQKQIASAFQAGVKDYFAEPYDIKLLAERIDALCVQLNSSNARVNCEN